MVPPLGMHRLWTFVMIVSLSTGHGVKWRSRLRSFSHIVSLGSFCQTAYQLNRMFPDYQSQMFDWWVTPTIGLIEMIEDDFAHIYQPENMRIVAEHTGNCVMCSRYGTMHFHDFKADSDRLFGPGRETRGTLKPLLVNAALARNLARAAHLYHRLSSLSGDVLFIRCGSGYAQHFDRNTDLNDELTLRLLNGLQNLAPAMTPTLLLLDTEYKTDRFKDVICRDIAHPVDDWAGSDLGWNLLFDELGYTLRGTAHLRASLPDRDEESHASDASEIVDRAYHPATS